MRKGLVTSILKSQQYLLENSNTKGSGDKITMALQRKIYRLRSLLSRLPKKPIKLTEGVYVDYLEEKILPRRRENFS